MVTDRDDWVARFALRLAMLDGSLHPLEQLIALGEELRVASAALNRKWWRKPNFEPEAGCKA